MSRRLRWGLLGTARINRSIIPRLKQLARHELLAVASRDGARARAYAREWEIPHACDSYDALLARDDIDAVYIPLPNALHAEWTVRAAHAGKHVLCEKPLATSVAEVDAIAAAARECGVCVAEAFMYRHHPQTERVREIVARGDLGEVRLIRGCFSFLLDRPDDVRWRPELGGGALWDIGCYPVSFARLLVGREPDEVFATAVRHPGGVDETSTGTLSFGGAATALIDCSFRAAFRTSMEVVGTDAVLTVPVPFKPGLAEQLVLGRGDARVTLEVEGEPLYAGELEDLARQVFDGAPARLPLEESRRNVQVLVALYRSAIERRPVALGEGGA